jgi:osmotically-inducible protein OsmY
MDPTDIAVSVKDGVVTLVGFVRRYTDKYEAEWAAKRVQGVVGIANDIEVRLPDADERPDPEIARDAVASIKLQLPDAWENITVIVRDAWVMLQGHVEWQYQREAAERAVRPIKGVKGITNLVRLAPKVAPSEVRRKIEEAFKRSAALDARSITVEVVGNEVILRGTVRSWSEYAEAERAAWAAPGVVKVTNELVVEP